MMMMILVASSQDIFLFLIKNLSPVLLKLSHSSFTAAWVVDLGHKIWEEISFQSCSDILEDISVDSGLGQEGWSKMHK